MLPDTRLRPELDEAGPAPAGAPATPVGQPGIPQQAGSRGALLVLESVGLSAADHSATLRMRPAVRCQSFGRRNPGQLAAENRKECAGWRLRTRQPIRPRR